MKNSYILLRSNKESGPHSFTDLESMGLKPDDLVWVEGQSVAWLSPAQIRELKPLVNGAVIVPQKQLVEVQEEEHISLLPEKEIYPANGNGHSNGNGYSQDHNHDHDDSQEASKYTNGIDVKRKSVFVSLPAQPVENKYAPQPELKKESWNNASSGNSEAQMETKYSQPLDEIKDMYVKTLQDRKRKNAYRKNLVKYLKIAAIFTGLIGIGAFAGISFYKAGNKKTTVTDTRANDPANGNGQTNNNTTPLLSLPVTVADSTVDTSAQLLLQPELTDPAADYDKMLKDQAARNKKAKEAAAKPENTVEPLNLPVNTTGEERNSRTRDEVKETKPVSLESIAPLVSVKSNNYKIGAFGGIKDLQLTVVNDSKYILDNVVVEVEYLKPSEESLKTERVYFKSVPPNGSQTLTVDKSNRGVKVNYKIIRIEPRANSGVAGL